MQICTARVSHLTHGIAGGSFRASNRMPRWSTEMFALGNHPQGQLSGRPEVVFVNKPHPRAKHLPKSGFHIGVIDVGEYTPVLQGMVSATDDKVAQMSAALQPGTPEIVIQRCQRSISRNLQVEPVVRAIAALYGQMKALPSIAGATAGTALTAPVSSPGTTASAWTSPTC